MKLSIKHMEGKEKEQYFTPATEVVEVKVNGVICISEPEGSGEDFTWDEPLI